MKFINETLDSVISNLNLNLQSEFVDLNSSLGRVLAKDFKAVRNSPNFDNSALDGYAYDANFAGKFLEIIEPTIFAGCKEIYEIKQNETQKIMTGAPFPKGANAVIRLEEAVFEDKRLKMPLTPRPGDGHRKAGEEFKKDEILIKKGEILTPNKILLIAGQGAGEVCVYKKPKIAVISSGNEVVKVGEKAGELQIYDANSCGICALLLQNGFECENLGIMKDDFNTTIKTIQDAFKKYDIIITSGGASVGEADFMQKALNELGFLQILSGVAVKPGGKPTKCFKSDEKIAFILPGNALPAYAMAYLMILPVLRYLSGALSYKNETITAKFGANLKLSQKRQDIVFGTYQNGEFTPNEKKMSSYMTSLAAISTHILLTPNDKDELKKGDFIEILKVY